MSGLRLGPGCRPVDPAPYLAVLESRFGMDPAWFTARYRFFEGGRKYVYVVSRAHAVPPGPEIAFSGIKLMRIAMKVPKLTTEAAVAVGHLATRNYVELSRPDAGRYLAREDITLDPQASAACTAPGYALVRLGPVTIGTAYLEPADAGSAQPAYRLRSWFPKHWSGVVRVQ